MRVEINNASVKKLKKIKGIGKKKAERIVEFRNNHGFFQTVEDIKKVKGIGKSIFNKIKDRIKVDNLKKIDFRPSDYNIHNVNEVHLVGTFNEWDPNDKNYVLHKKEDDYWSAKLPVEEGAEFKIMYDSESWEDDKYIGDLDGGNIVVNE